MLKISHIAKTFNPGTVNEKKAIEDLSLELKKGDFATIIGSNGAGKSTLFNAVCGDFMTDAGCDRAGWQGYYFHAAACACKGDRAPLSGSDARNCTGDDDRRKSCPCSRKGRLAFSYKSSGKRKIP